MISAERKDIVSIFPERLAKDMALFHSYLLVSENSRDIVYVKSNLANWKREGGRRNA